MKEIEVGKIYKCGDEKVKIVCVDPMRKDGGHTFNNNLCPTFVGVSLDKDGDISGLSYFGGFSDIGDYYSYNCRQMQHVLKEIPEETPKEMTVGEVRKALGMKEELKIVEGREDTCIEYNKWKESFK